MSKKFVVETSEWADALTAYVIEDTILRFIGTPFGGPVKVVEITGTQIPEGETTPAVEPAKNRHIKQVSLDGIVWFDCNEWQDTRGYSFMRLVKQK